jgi:serine/threonine-protein kinase RsbW
MSARRCNPIRFEIRRTLPAGLRFVDKVSMETRGKLLRICSGPDVFSIELLLREALTNAALHGCGLDPLKQVVLLIRVRDNRAVIAVSDEGAGFDWRSGLGRNARDSDTSGRGLSIYRAYANRVRFNGNGSAVVLVRSLSPD